MRKLLFFIVIGVTFVLPVKAQVIVQKDILYPQSVLLEGVKTELLYLNGAPYTGTRDGIFVYEKTRLPQGNDETMALLHVDDPAGTPPTKTTILFTKTSGGYWEKVALFTGIIPEFSKYPDGRIGIIQPATSPLCGLPPGYTGIEHNTLMRFIVISPQGEKYVEWRYIIIN